MTIRRTHLVSGFTNQTASFSESANSATISLSFLPQVLPTLHVFFNTTSIMFSTSLGISAGLATGVLAHILIFRKGEWDLYTIKILQGLLVITVLLSLSFMRLGTTEAGSPYSFLESIIASIYMVSIMTSGMFCSISLYRISFFHRLYQFPGPAMARVSNLYLTRRSVTSFQLYREIQDLHQMYGDIVRVGPSALSILDAKAFHAIHSNNSPCTKGPWYNIEQPAISLHMSRDKNDHSRRKRAWDKAFSSRALRDYQPRVVKYTNLLLDRLEQSQGTPIDIPKWFKFYSFDTMGDLAFGQSFSMLTNGVKHPFMALVESHMAMAGTFSQLIWMFPLFRALPFLGWEDAIFQKWLGDQVQHQELNKPDLPNIFSWLLEDYKSKMNPKEQDWLNLQADMQLIAVAGSDTTSVTLTCLFYLLATNNDAFIRLQEEIDNLFSSSSLPNHSNFSKLTYLQACIDETLRLFPPVPSGLQRMTPPEGLRVGDIFIPGDTIVTVPSYTLYRDERYFTAPDDFVPERWTTNPEMVKDGSVFAPFSFGRYACMGKQLGLMEVGYATCIILHRFDICLAGEGASSKLAFLKGLKDHFTLDAPELQMVLTARKK